MRRHAIALFSGKLKQTKVSDKLVTNNFSYREVVHDDKVLIHEDQQMIVEDRIRVQGQLIVLGELRVQEQKTFEAKPDNFSFQIVSSKVTVPASQQMLLQDFLRIDSGALYVFGSFVVLGELPLSVSKRLARDVEDTQLYVVETTEEYYFRDSLRIAGKVQNSGRIAVGA